MIFLEEVFHLLCFRPGRFDPESGLRLAGNFTLPSIEGPNGWIDLNARRSIFVDQLPRQSLGLFH